MTSASVLMSDIKSDAVFVRYAMRKVSKSHHMAGQVPAAKLEIYK